MKRIPLLFSSLAIPRFCKLLSLPALWSHSGFFHVLHDTPTLRFISSGPHTSSHSPPVFPTTGQLGLFPYQKRMGGKYSQKPHTFNKWWCKSNTRRRSSVTVLGLYPFGVISPHAWDFPFPSPWLSFLLLSTYLYHRRQTICNITFLDSR